MPRLHQDTCSPDTSCIHLYFTCIRNPDTSCSSGILVSGYMYPGVNTAFESWSLLPEIKSEVSDDDRYLLRCIFSYHLIFILFRKYGNTIMSTLWSWSLTFQSLKLYRRRKLHLLRTSKCWTFCIISFWHQWHALTSSNKYKLASWPRKLWYISFLRPSRLDVWLWLINSNPFTGTKEYFYWIQTFYASHFFS